MNESILILIIYGMTAMIMIAIGITPLRSKKPVGFYSGERAPREDEIRDVRAWNKKHGMMWLIYGIIIMVSWFLGAMIGDSAFSLIPFCGGLLIPIVVMIYYHHRLIKLYRK